MTRIHHEDNPFYSLPDGGLSLGIMRLEDFYVQFPSMFILKYLHHVIDLHIRTSRSTGTCRG